MLEARQEAAPRTVRNARELTLDSLLEALNCVAVLVDESLHLRRSNLFASQWLGCRNDELEGMSYQEWCRRVEEAYTRVSPGPVPTELEAEWDERLESRIGPRRIYRRAARPMPNDEGEIIGRLELIFNISELVRMEDENARLQTHAPASGPVPEVTQGVRPGDLERLKVELLASVSHDLRTPLASIKASVSGLLAGDIDYNAQELRETLTLIEEETDRLQRRVANMLSMARMESGDSLLAHDWVDIQDVVATALESMRALRGDREVKLDFPDELPLLLGDYDQLVIAVRNLLENAFQYAPKDKPIEISVGGSLGRIRIRVRDYGTGLMPDEFERIFDKFYRGRSARSIPGTGLGLPICRAIAEAHGGRLWAEHAPGGGVAFVISLPVPEQSPAEQREPD